MGSLSLAHWLIVLVVVLLLFGGSRLAGVGKGLGDGVKAFKKAVGDESSDGQRESRQMSERSRG